MTKAAWRQRLTPRDVEIIQKWVDESGLERVALIVSVLAESTGERLSKPHSLPLLKMAHLLAEDPSRSLRDVAVQVAQATRTFAKNPPSEPSFVTELSRGFRSSAGVFENLAKKVPAPTDDEIQVDRMREKTDGEYRALSRLIDLLPGWIDIVDALKAEATTNGEEERELLGSFVKSKGRREVGKLVLERANQRSWRDPITRAHARRFLDFIRPELEAFRVKREAPPQATKKRAPRVGRKSVT